MGRRTRQWSAFAVPALAVMSVVGWGCGEGSGPEDETPPFTAIPVEEEGPVIIDLDIDADNTGIIERTDDEEDKETDPLGFDVGEYWKRAGKELPPNNNDNDGDYVADKDDEVVNPPNDLLDMAKMVLQVDVPDDYDPTERSLMLAIDHSRVIAGEHIRVFVDQDPDPLLDDYQKLDFVEETKPPPAPPPATQAEVAPLSPAWFSGKGDLLFLVGSKGNQTEFSFASALDPGTWIHVACTFDLATATAKVYVTEPDGVPSSASIAIPAGQGVGNLDKPLRLGTPSQLPAPLPGVEMFLGALDDVRIYAQALSQGDVESLAAGVDPGVLLVAHWMLDDLPGPTADDATANAYDGTLMPDFGEGNAPQWVAGHIGGGLAFDGRDDYVACGATPGSATDLTVAFWLKVDGLGLQTLAQKFPDDDTGTGWAVKLRRSTGLADFRVEGVKPGRLGIAALDRETAPEPDFDLNNDWVWVTVTGINLLGPPAGTAIPVGPGRTTTIGWECFPHANVRIEYSTDDGFSYQLASPADVPPGYFHHQYHRNFRGSWDWDDVPEDDLGKQCTIRVSVPNPLYPDPSPVERLDDVSEAKFLFTGIRITSPTADSFYDVDGPMPITWESWGVDNVRIELSRDNGTSWETIIDSVPALPGSFTWTSVTGLGSGQCLIKVSDVAEVNQPALSDLFRIRSIEVTSPNGGEMFCPGTIHWTALGFAGSELVEVFYSVDSGGTYPDLNSIATVPANDGQCTWVPSVNSFTCRIKTQTQVGVASDESDADFCATFYFVVCPDASYSRPLTDWPDDPASGVQRSPRFVFSQNDRIYVQFHQPGMVSVTSESDAAGIAVDLVYAVPPGAWRGQLRLGDASVPGDRIQVTEEELVTFAFAGGQFVHALMVDRAEFASCGVEVFYSSPSGDRDVVRTGALTNAAMWDNGDGDYQDNVVARGNPMRPFIKNMGLQTHEADMMHVSSHADEYGNLWDNANGLIIRGTGIWNLHDWNNDAEWVCLASCLQLNVPGGGKAAWQTALAGNPRPMHGILGAWHLLSANLQSQYAGLWTRLLAGEKVISAYANAMELDGFTQPWAVLYYVANRYDKLYEMTADVRPEASMAIEYLDTSVPAPWRIDSRKVKDTVDNGNCSVYCAWPGIPKAMVLTSVRLTPCADHARPKPAFARTRTRARNGGVVFLDDSAEAQEESKLSEDEASALVGSLLQETYPQLWSRLRLKDIGTRGRILLKGEKQEEVVTGYFLQYDYVITGVPVQGASVRARITGNRVTMLLICCPREVEPTEQTPLGSPRARPINAKRAILGSLDDIKTELSIKGKWRIDAVNLCYTQVPRKAQNKPTEYKPVWRIAARTVPSGLHRVVCLDALSGRLVAVETP